MLERLANIDCVALDKVVILFIAISTLTLTQTTA